MTAFPLAKITFFPGNGLSTFPGLLTGSAETSRRTTYPIFCGCLSFGALSFNRATHSVASPDVCNPDACNPEACNEADSGITIGGGINAAGEANAGFGSGCDIGNADWNGLYSGEMTETSCETGSGFEAVCASWYDIVR